MTSPAHTIYASCACSSLLLNINKVYLFVYLYLYNVFCFVKSELKKKL